MLVQHLHQKTTVLDEKWLQNVAFVNYLPCTPKWRRGGTATY